MGGDFARLDPFGGMMLRMPGPPSLDAESRWTRWMRENRLVASVTVGVTVGLVWGVTTGVGFAVLVGDGLLGTWAVFVPGGFLVGALVGYAIHRGTRSIGSARELIDRRP
jgi:hypothetical protein